MLLSAGERITVQSLNCNYILFSDINENKTDQCVSEKSKEELKLFH